MNSFISNSEVHTRQAHRKYVLRLVSIVVALGLGLFALGLYLQPLYGDLTRIGGYSEREFGWVKPQLRFDAPLFTQDQYAKPHDVVVLGDSFSRERPQYQWQNWFIAETAWSMVTLDINTTRLDQILENPIFRDAPPKLLIVESVERVFVTRFSGGPPCDISSLSPSAPMGFQTPYMADGKFKNTAQDVERDKQMSEVKLGFALRYLWYTALRGVGLPEQTHAIKIELSKPAPFSSEAKQSMLIVNEDFAKIAAWQAANLGEIACKIERFRRLVEANGKTRFVLMVAPDKLTAYADLIADQRLQNISRLAEIGDQNPAVMPRIDLALISAIHKGEQDIYLPDDTHWGSSGHRIVADTLLKFLRAHG